MHIEKNVFDNCYGTISNLDGRTKDNLQARLDLVEMNIRPDLHPQEKPSGKFYLPPALFAMSKSERRAFCDFLRKVKVPDVIVETYQNVLMLLKERLLALKHMTVMS